MSTPTDTGSKRDEESLEETLAKLVFLNGFISKAKEERARLFEKIAKWQGNQAESESNSATAITKEAQIPQVAQTGLASTDANDVKIVDAEDGMKDPRIIPDEVKAGVNATTIPDVENRGLTPVSSLSTSSTDTDQTLPSDGNPWVIKDPPSPQRFSGAQNDHGVSMCIPACTRGIFVNEERGASSDKPSAPDIFEDRDAIPFRAIVDIGTADSFVTSSFIAANATSNDTFFGDQVLTATPRPTNRVQFTFSPQYRQEGHNNTTLQLAISGRICVPIEIEGHLFWAHFYICEEIMAKDEHAKIFPVILGSRFLEQIFVQIQSAEGGWLIRLPPLAPPEFTNLAVYTHGCREDVGTPATEGLPVKEAKHGYGIHFPSLPAGWDMHAAARPETPCIVTTELAELVAVARALNFVYERLIRPYRNRVGSSLGGGPRCKKIIIYTESNDAISGFHNHLSKWRTNGYKTAKKKTVANMSAWKSVAIYSGLLFMNGITVTLINVTIGTTLFNWMDTLAT